jgi:hypothetical protein
MDARTRWAPERVALGAIAAASFAVGAVVIAWLAQLLLGRPIDLGGALATGACTSVLGTGVGLLGIASKRSDAIAGVLTVGLAIGAGILCSPLSLLAVQLTTDPAPFRDGELDTLLIAATCLGAFYAVPLGALFGMAFVPPVLWARRLGADASHERVDRAHRAAGAWLAAAGALALALAPDGPPFWPWLAGSPLVAGSILAVAGIARIERRRRWFLGIAAGLRPGWAVVPRSTLVRTTDLRPLFRCEGGDRMLVVRRIPHPGGAYRSAGDDVPFALAPDPGSLELS